MSGSPQISVLVEDLRRIQAGAQLNETLVRDAVMATATSLALVSMVESTLRNLSVGAHGAEELRTQLAQLADRLRGR